MDEFIRDYEFYVTTFLALVAITVSIFLYYLPRPKKTFTYKPIASTSLLSVAEEIEGRIQIIYDNEPVEKVHLFVLKLITGKVPIRIDDYHQPVKIRFGKRTKVLSADISEERPKIIDAKISFENNTIELEPVKLDANQSITIKCFLKNFDGEFDVKGDIFGVSEIQKHDSRRRTFMLSVITNALMIVFILLAFWQLFLGGAVTVPSGPITISADVIGFLMFLTLAIFMRFVSISLMMSENWLLDD